MVTSSSVDEKRSSSRTRISSQRSVGTEGAAQKAEVKTSPKPKEVESEAVSGPKVTDTASPFLLLSQVCRFIKRAHEMKRFFQEAQEFHNSAITQCKFNNSGSLVASGDADGVVKVWCTSPAPR